MRLNREQAIEMCCKTMASLLEQLPDDVEVTELSMKVRTESGPYRHEDEWSLFPRVYDLDAEFEEMTRGLES